MAPVYKGRECRHSGIYLLGDKPHSNVTDSHTQWPKLGKDFGTVLQLGFGRRKIARRHRILEAGARVGSIAKRFVGRLPAAAEGNHGTAGQAEGGAGGVQNLEVAFDTDGPVVHYGNFGW